MRTVKVQTHTPRNAYDIIIERGLIKNVGSLVKNVSSASKVTVITDSNVEKIYAEGVVSSLKESGFDTSLFVFPAGEKSKTLSTVSDMYDHMVNFRMSRKDIVVALGGGVTGDMAGFAAASYMRGIDFVQIPTSLLAQVDSSVGGKTGVNIKQGKNLVGAFHQPILVIIDPDTLKTLPDYYINDGMAEVIKYGCIKDSELFKTLEDKNALDIIEDVIEQCVSIKRDVVNRDEKEAGERMLLNFGHTLGHSLEKIYNFEGLSHGQAVAIGMVMITAASENAGITEKGTTVKIISLCKKYGLPVEDKADKEEIAAICAGDKKAGSGSVNLVLLTKIGESFTKKTPLSELEEFISI
ncbi:MAG: 3-dehydroquinate synthase [Ruminococcus sp.]|nr:3-dehydroquinate synthase [Ruminococcus sp.]